MSTAAPSHGRRCPVDDFDFRTQAQRRLGPALAEWGPVVLFGCAVVLGLSYAALRLYVITTALGW